MAGFPGNQTRRRVVIGISLIKAARGKASWRGTSRVALEAALLR